MKSPLLLVQNQTIMNIKHSGDKQLDEADISRSDTRPSC